MSGPTWSPSSPAIPSLDQAVLDANDRGIEVSQVFQLGTKYSEAMGATFMDEDGKEKPLIMGCYGVGVSRSLAAVVEQHNDEHGIVWPVSVAPYEVAVIPLDPKKEECATVCEQIVDGLCAEGIEVVVDDRDERPGFKFADNDLMGFPYQVVLGKRGLKNGTVELKDRATGDREDVAIDEIVAKVAELVKAARRSSAISLVVRYTGRPRISPDRGDVGPSFYLVASSISKRKTPRPMRAAGFPFCASDAK